MTTPPDTAVPVEAGGAHYGQSLQPWDLQRHMKSSGSAFVDARRADAIKYAYRMKGGQAKLLDDLKKARHCLDAAIQHMEEHLQPEESSASELGEVAGLPDLPEDVVEPETGWYYVGLGPLDIGSVVENSHDLAVLRHGKWDYTGWHPAGDGWHYAVRVNSRIWDAYFAHLV